MNWFSAGDSTGLACTGELACTDGLDGRLASGVITGETDGLSDCTEELAGTAIGTSQRPTFSMASNGPVAVFLVNGILLGRN